MAPGKVGRKAPRSLQMAWFHSGVEKNCIQATTASSLPCSLRLESERSVETWNCQAALGPETALELS